MSTQWTEPVIERMKELRLMGRTFEEVAGALTAEFQTSLSRNAIIGKARRIGFDEGNKSRAYPKPPKAIQPPKPVKMASRETGSFAYKVPRAIKAKQLGDDASDVALPKSNGPIGGFRRVSLFDLKSDECRWPEGDGPFTFCGQPQQDGQSYCSAHCAIAYTPAALRKKIRFNTDRTSRASLRFGASA